MKKSLNTLIIVAGLIIVSIILLLLVIKPAKNLNYNFNLDKTKTYQFIYEKVSDSYINQIKSFCQRNNLNCIFNHYDNVVSDENTIDILIGFHSNLKKVLFGVVEEPVFFYEFNKIPTKISIKSNSPVYIEDSNLVLDNNGLVDAKLSFENQVGDKFFIKIKKNVEVILNLTNKVIDINIGDSVLKINIDGKSYYLVSLPYNDIAVKTGNNALLKVNGNIYKLNETGKIQYVELKGYSIHIDEAGLFTRNVHCENCMKLADDFSGSELTDVVVMYDFLPYLKEPKGYVIHFFTSNREKKIETKYYDVKNDLVYSEGDNLYISTSLLANNDFKDVIIEYLKKFPILPLFAHIQNVDIKSYYKLYLITTAYEDIESSDVKPYRDIVDFNNKEVIVKTLRMGKKLSYDVAVGDYVFRTLPYSSSIDYTMSFISNG